MHLKKSHNQLGQGLLEVIIGVGVIVAGTVGSITLISATVNAGRSTNNKVVAASLAREGIEVVRNLRDSNWLAIQANVTGVTSFSGIFDASGSKNHYVIPSFDQVSSWTLGALPVLTVPVAPATTILDSQFAKQCPLPSGTSWTCSNVFSNANGYFQKTSGTPGTASRFTRLIEVHPICRVDGNPLDGIADTGNAATERIVTVDGTSCRVTTGTDNETLVGLQVVTTVRWQEGTGQKTFSLEDRLYNWRYIQ